MTTKTKQALTGLEWALAQTIEQPKQPDEFTAEEYARLGKVPLSSARWRLYQMAGNGKLIKRSASINGKRTNLYRKA